METQEQFHGYAAYDEKCELRPYSYTPKPLGDNEVEVQISHCGICRSDIHTMTGGWGPVEYPLITGHEIIGKVVKKGANATELNIGDRVGVGIMLDACLECEECNNNMDQLCRKRRVLAENDVWKNPDGSNTQYRTHGGYADRIRVSKDYAFLIPPELSSAEAAPLMCAGFTTFAPLQSYKVGKGHRVCIIGVGGLGHMAIQWASKMGAEVTVLSHSMFKEEDARKLGATDFFAIDDSNALMKARYTFDYILSTSPDPKTDFSTILALLRPCGTFILLGAPEETLQVPPMSLFTNQARLTATVIGSRQDMKDMLAFAAKHGVRPWFECLPMKECNTGIQKTRDNQARYRFVLVNEAS